MNLEFSQVLKLLRKNKGYTQNDLAKLLNLGQTTIANYENGTRVPDIYKLSEIADLFHVTIDFLIGKKDNQIKEFEVFNVDKINNLEQIYKLYKYLIINGEKNDATLLCLSLIENGMQIHYLYEKIIKKLLIEVGVMWEKGTLDIWQEHLISGITIDIIKTISFTFNLKNNNKKNMLALTPGAESHNIGLLIVSSVLESMGWNCLFLGSNIPTLSVIDAIDKNDLDAIALSITMPAHIESSIYLVESIKQTLHKDLPDIIIGGTALSGLENPLKVIGADFYFKSMNELVSFINNN